MKRSLLLYASLVVSFSAGSSAPTPLYSVYQRAWGFSPVMVTAVFAIYALAVLAALLVVGSLSDFVGRRPVLLVATVLQTVSMGVFVGAHGVGALIAARVVQGLATGAAVGAAGAGMIDVDRERGTLVNGFVPMLGTGAGSVVSGFCVAFLPAPTKLVYVILAVIFVAQTIGVATMPESASPAPGAFASLRTLHAVSATSVVEFFVGTSIAGAGFGASFQGAIRSVIGLAAPHERAGVLSVLFVVSYLAMGLPAVAAGLLVVHAGGILATARDYGLAVIMLAVAAMTGTLLPRRRATMCEVPDEKCLPPASKRARSRAASPGGRELWRCPL